jgi:hypothetical protein
MQVTLDVPEQFGLDYTLEFAGVDSYRFYEECAKHKIPVINYEPGELEAELEALRDCCVSSKKG